MRVELVEDKGAGGKRGKVGSIGEKAAQSTGSAGGSIGVPSSCRGAFHPSPDFSAGRAEEGLIDGLLS